MITPENVKLKDWIRVGERDGVISKIYESENNKFEFVYLDRNRAINEDIYYVDGEWKFFYSGPCGGYADDNPRLAEYVSILRAGQWWK